MISEKERQWMERWSQFRAKGRWRGIFIQGGTFLLFYIILMAVLTRFLSFPDPFFENLASGDTTKVGITILIYLAAGLSYGMFNWSMSERRYKRLTRGDQ
ncbi:hypothetical protein HZ996_00895 [Cryomorphaceae bacterium]|nr:hypothetical protein HZ996_00895 [Cryomorphaceae bacterium]